MDNLEGSGKDDFAIGARSAIPRASPRVEAVSAWWTALGGLRLELVNGAARKSRSSVGSGCAVAGVAKSLVFGAAG